MGKRKIDLVDNGSVLVETSALETQSAEASALEAPTIEERVAHLESLLEATYETLKSKDHVINVQAAQLVTASENADRLRRSRERVDRLESVAEERKKSASEAKKAYEEAVKEHFELEAEIDSPQGRLPFPPEPSSNGKPDDALPADAGASESPRADDSWRRDAIISVLNLPASVVSKLADAQIFSIGDLSDYLQPSATGYTKQLTDLPGIGKSKAEAIQDALVDYWGSRAGNLNDEILGAVRETEAEKSAEDPAYAEALARTLANPSDGDDEDDWEDSEDSDSDPVTPGDFPDRDLDQ